MQPEQLEAARQRLLAMREALIAERDATASDAAPVELDQARVGRLSRMDDMQQQAMAVELGRRREIQLQRIEGAFLRIEKGTYGCCATCGTVITPERLDFDPTVFFCIACAARAERK